MIIKLYEKCVLHESLYISSLFITNTANCNLDKVSKSMNKLRVEDSDNEDEKMPEEDYDRAYDYEEDAKPGIFYITYV